MPRVITGTGSYLPEQVVSNDALLEFVENFDERRAGCTLDEWYQRRYGEEPDPRYWGRVVAEVADSSDCGLCS